MDGRLLKQVERPLLLQEAGGVSACCPIVKVKSCQKQLECRKSSESRSVPRPYMSTTERLPPNLTIPVRGMQNDTTKK